MKLGMVGLGRMGGNMARRICRAGIEVVGFNRTAAVTRHLASAEGLIAADSLPSLVAQLPVPRVVWLMLPSGAATQTYLDQLASMLSAGDVIVDGGNADYRDSLRRAEALAASGIDYVDAGTSGGVWGLDNGYCMMVGGNARAVQLLQPVLQALAPATDHGWAHVGPVGAGHFAKMVHNGIEYGMMQAMAEGLSLLEAKTEFDFDLAKVTELWRHGSVVRSWLLDLTAEALASDQSLESVAPYVADSGEGRWSAREAIELGVAAPVLSLALQMRFASQDQRGYGNRLLATMRNAFGGHAIKPVTPEVDD